MFHPVIIWPISNRRHSEKQLSVLPNGNTEKNFCGSLKLVHMLLQLGRSYAVQRRFFISLLSTLLPPY